MQDKEQLEELRRKLYARPVAADSIERHGLSDVPVDVSRDWDIPDVATPQPELVVEQEVEIPDQIPAASEAIVAQPRRRYRVWILLISLFVFVFGVGLSSLYLYLGGNQISSDNIDVSINGPFTIGGGEVMSLQIGVSNQNSVAVDAATLIVKYPPGTRSIGDAPRNLFEERVPIDSIAPGEARNIPLQVVVFGEERVEQQITATLEYRIAGSNGIFQKDAEPLPFSISSSPLVLRLESVEKVASGQTVDVLMTVVSNASAPIQDVLISAEYPNGFKFESAEPAPVFGENVWRISELLPEESIEIKLTGVILGLTEEAFQINFNAGPAKSDNPYIVGSRLAESSINFFIERPFIDVVTAINGEVERSVVLDEAESSTVSVDITNTLDETVYDLVVEVVPGGNALSETSVRGNSGFYDSNTGTVRWEVANNNTFATVRPGETRSLTFSVSPNAPRATASYDLVVNVYARRVAETSAAEQLIGTALVEAKYSSALFTGSQAGHGGIFSPLGSLPPTVGETTTYTLTLVAEAGVNDLTDALINTSLPVYIDWLDKTQGEGEIEFNPVSKQLEWNIGNMISGQRKEVSFQVALTPSTSQVGGVPILLNAQTMRATDRFTSERLQAKADPVYTELSTEAGYEEDNGIVAR
jgi:hypothetical protein